MIKKTIIITLVVVATLIVLFFVAGLIFNSSMEGKVNSFASRAHVTKAEMDMKQIKEFLELYKLDNGEYPTTEQGLDALVKKPEIEPIPEGYRKGGYRKGGYVEEIPKDYWGKEYIYKSPAGDNKDYEIISYGLDGVEGGEGENTDISFSK